MAKVGKKTWMKHGALDYYECVADDLKSWGLGYAKMAKLKKGETVVVAFVVYKSRAHRDRVNAKVMKEFAADGVEMEMPFDVKRMANGGFTVIVGS
jgi:alkaline phosphatase